MSGDAGTEEPAMTGDGDALPPLYAMQERTLAWARERERSGARGGIVADEQGLGKTRIFIELMRGECKGTGEGECEGGTGEGEGEGEGDCASLVVCETSVLAVWQAELARWHAGARILTLHGAPAARALDALPAADAHPDALRARYDVVLTTFGTVRALFTRDVLPHARRAVLDAHRRRVPESQYDKDVRQWPRLAFQLGFGALEHALGVAAPPPDGGGGAPYCEAHVLQSQSDGGGGGATGARLLFGGVRPWRRIVVDEFHVLRNSASRTTHAVMRLWARHYWASTGTPVHNSVTHDLYPALAFVRHAELPRHASVATSVRLFDALIARAAHDARASASKKAKFKRLARQEAIDARATAKLGARGRAYYARLCARVHGMATVDRWLAACMYRQTGATLAAHESNVLAMGTLTEHVLAWPYQCAAEAEFYMRTKDNLGALVLAKRQRRAAATITNRSRTNKGKRRRVAQAPAGPAGPTGPATAAADGADGADGPDGAAGSTLPLLMVCRQASLAAGLAGLSSATTGGTTGGTGGTTSGTTGAAWAWAQSTKLCMVRHRLRTWFAPAPPPPPHAPPHATDAEARDARYAHAAHARHHAEPARAVLVFSNFTSMLNLIAAHVLDDAGYTYCRLDGSDGREVRARAVARFQRGECQVFLISLAAAATGLTLTHASHVLFPDPWYNPMAEEQATKRAHRIGQPRNVTVTRLMVRGTIEERIFEVAREKHRVTSALMARHTTTTTGTTTGTTTTTTTTSRARASRRGAPSALSTDALWREFFADSAGAGSNIYRAASADALLALPVIDTEREHWAALRRADVARAHAAYAQRMERVRLARLAAFVAGGGAFYEHGAPFLATAARRVRRVPLSLLTSMTHYVLLAGATAGHVAGRAMTLRALLARHCVSPRVFLNVRAARERRAVLAVSTAAAPGTDAAITIVEVQIAAAAAAASPPAVLRVLEVDDAWTLSLVRRARAAVASASAGRSDAHPPLSPLPALWHTVRADGKSATGAYNTESAIFAWATSLDTHMRYPGVYPLDGPFDAWRKSATHIVPLQWPSATTNTSTTTTNTAVPRSRWPTVTVVRAIRS
jgi:hypothetical protein